MRLALTVADDDPMAARGAIRDFWHAYRETFGRRAYFSWAELQRRGAVHYHAILVSPPWRKQRDARRWLTRHWPLSRIQPVFDFAEWSWFVRAGGDYVKKYARKAPVAAVGSETAKDEGKSYQQAYDDLPREIRTWECNRLSVPVGIVDLHLDRWEVVCTAEPFAPWYVKARNLWLVAKWAHETYSGGCSLRQTTARYASRL